MEDSCFTDQYCNIRRWADTVSTPEGETIGRMEASPPESKDDILEMKAGTFTAYDRYYYLKDHLGSIRVTLKDNGSVAGYDDYYPFGLQMPGRSSNTANTHADQKYTGHFLESEGNLGLYHAQARLYDPEVPRFYGVDAMRGDMPGWNPYHYTFNNPVRFVDPDGNMPQDCPECSTEAHIAVRNAYLNETWTEFKATATLFAVKSVEFFGNIGRIGTTTDTKGNTDFSIDADLASVTIDENSEPSESYSLGTMANISNGESGGIESGSISIPVTKAGTMIEVGANNSGDGSLGVVQNIGKHISIGIRVIMNPGENIQRSAEMMHEAKEETRHILD
jgi:RHS repeat-associated protein